MAKMTEKKIRESLMSQLKAKSENPADHFTSLVEDYIWYWKQEQSMQADIRERGTTYPAISAAGKEYEKDNPSVKNALLYNKQKLSILKELGLTTANAGSADNEL